MFCKLLTRRVLLVALTFALALLVTMVILSSAHPDMSSESGIVQLPLDTPSLVSPSLPLPTLSQHAPSTAAQKALLYIANRESVPTDTLTVVADHPTEYPALGRRFQVVTLLDTWPDGQVHKLLVDLADGRVEENISDLLAAEAQAHQSRYGKLEPALYERLQAMSDKDTVPVAVWVAARPGKSVADQQEAVFAVLAARYPKAKAAMEQSGKPMDVDDPELVERIYAEYIELLDAETLTRTRPLVIALEQQGFTVTIYKGMPSFTSILSKQVILELSQREDVSSIYLIEAEKQQEMNSVAPTILAPTVWEQGYDGNGITVAILDIGNIDPNNTFLRLSSNSRPGAINIFDHATETAGVVASFHDTFKGIAHGATILSLGESGTQADEITAI